MRAKKTTKNAEGDTKLKMSDKKVQKSGTNSYKLARTKKKSVSIHLENMKILESRE